MSSVTSFADSDSDFQGLDGRDLSMTWDNSAAL
jgi:hypothetical protein